MRPLLHLKPDFPSIAIAPNSSRANSYPHSLNPPSVNFMMLPLCTSVTDFFLCSIAYSIAFFISLWLPSLDTGLIPIAVDSGKRILFLKPNSEIN